MRKWYLVPGLLCGLAIAIAAQSGSQPASTSEPQSAQTAAPDDQSRIVLDVTRVPILFTVTDRRGRFVSGLTKDDFEVYDGRNRQTILEFSSESDLPLRLAILIDTSNSIRERFRFQQEAAVEFLSSVMRTSDDEALVFSFDTAANLKEDLTSDPNKLEETIRALRPGGGTALYDAIYLACRDKLVQEQQRYRYRRAMVILSDGEDNQSRYSRDQALEMAQKADVVIYSISTNISRIQTGGDKVLKYFAEETGGRTFFPFKVEDLEQSFENIANEMRHQYNILYKPEPMWNDGQYHEVEIRVKGRKDLVTRARHGYYALKL